MVRRQIAFVESLFRTAKYGPESPGSGFASLDHVRQWASNFVRWYNHKHRHSGIRSVTRRSVPPVKIARSCWRAMCRTCPRVSTTRSAGRDIRATGSASTWSRSIRSEIPQWPSTVRHIKK